MDTSALLANTTFQTGVGIGTILAIVMSWTRNQSFIWACIHAFFGWLYVIWYILTR